jgi:hypothetical protein
MLSFRIWDRGEGTRWQYKMSKHTSDRVERTRWKYKMSTLTSKGQLHEIFDPRFFFHQSTPPRALIHGLRPFRIWPCWNRFWRLSMRLSRRIRSHMRNGFSMLIRDLYGVDWWKKTRESISWHCPFKLNRKHKAILLGGTGTGSVIFSATILFELSCSVLSIGKMLLRNICIGRP